KINMVIVKDLSRFGREYAQMGMYIEHYFEQKGVRFLSVAENIDSANGLDNLVLPFTNVINSFYARQSSSKTKAAHQARAKSGMFLGSRVPFGYTKDPADRHHLIVDPPAARGARHLPDVRGRHRLRPHDEDPARARRAKPAGVLQPKQPRLLPERILAPASRLARDLNPCHPQQSRLPR
ncbi:MAG: recombinase family protein, partial [Oscillospiraceae bacterium]|nr:recombinase family protein [Oscillospiraceae bacterium]